MVEIVRAKKAKKELPKKKTDVNQNQGQGLDDERIENLPPTISAEEPTITVTRDYNKVSIQELESIREDLQKVENDKGLRQDRYQVKLRMQEQQNEQLDKELQALSMKVREKQQELNLIEHQLRGLPGGLPRRVGVAQS